MFIMHCSHWSLFPLCIVFIVYCNLLCPLCIVLIVYCSPLCSLCIVLICCIVSIVILYCTHCCIVFSYCYNIVQSHMGQFSETWMGGMLDSLIDPSSPELEPAQSLVGWIGLGPKLWLKYRACPPRGSQSQGFRSVFQVVERLAPWVVLPVAALGLTGLDQCPEHVLNDVWESY